MKEELIYNRQMDHLQQEKKQQKTTFQMDTTWTLS